MAFHFEAWDLTLIKVGEQTKVFTRSGIWVDRDALGREPWEINAALVAAGAKIQPEMVKPLSAKHLPPKALEAAIVTEVLERETRGVYQFRPLGDGKGGRLEVSSREDKEITHIIWQLGGGVDGGLLKYLVEKRARIERKLVAIATGAKSGFVSMKERKFLAVMRKIEGFMADEQDLLLEEEKFETTVWHIVAYVQPYAVSLHPDRRLSSPRALRATLPAFVSMSDRAKPASVRKSTSSRRSVGCDSLISTQAREAAAHVLGAGAAPRCPLGRSAAAAAARCQARRGRKEGALRPRGRGALWRVQRPGALQRSGRRRLPRHPARGRRARLAAVALALVAVGREARREMADPGHVRPFRVQNYLGCLMLSVLFTN